jgi:hypothetical protein
MTASTRTQGNKPALSMPRLLLHLEGAAVLIAAVAAYALLDFGWGTFALLFLAPDLALVPYILNRRIGSLVYNLLHTTIFPLILATYGLISGSDPALRVALIWFAHIGMDRMVGYGLKYPGELKVTHLNRI